MPKASPLQPSFEVGEISPKVYGRTDAEQYKKALAQCTNYIPITEGPLIRRPGFKYAGFDVKDPAVPPVFIPFQVSKTDAYILECGDQYMRFYKNLGRVVVAGTTYFGTGSWYDPSTVSSAASTLIPENFYAVRKDISIRNGEKSFGASQFSANAILELPTPFNSSDISALRWNGSFDTLYLTTGAHMIYKLQRFGEYDWALKPIIPIDGPYMPFNSHSYSGDAAGVTLNPQGANFKGLTTVETGPKATVTNVTNDSWGPNSSYFVVQVTTNPNHSFVIGQKIFYGGDPNTNLPGTTFVVGAVGSNTFKVNNPFPISGSFSGSAFAYPALFDDNDSFRLLALSSGGKRYWGFINAPSGSAAPQVANYAMCSPLPNTSAISAWQLGVWRTNEWPKTSTFHQNRLFFAGNVARPLEICGSVTADYENFQTSNSSYVAADNSALQFQLQTNQLNATQWISSDANGLLVGGYSSEWKVTPSSQGQALTPANLNAVEASYFGSADAQPLKIGPGVLYIQRSNRSLRELNYFFQFNNYRSTDLNQMSDNITFPGITLLSDQRETSSVVWSLRKDGTLLGMSYGREDQGIRAGWSSHQLGGKSDSGGSAPQVVAMAAIAGSGALFDQLWVATRRFINGTTVVNVEYMTQPYNDGNRLVEDAAHLDCAGTYDSPVSITNVSIAGSCVITAPSHGMVDGDSVQITKVLGVNSSTADINGILTTTNLVNYNTFRVGSASTNSFFLQDINNGSSYIDSRGYSIYVAGGEARKLVSTITGLGWLTGETVSVLADGKIHPPTTVASGGILALSFPAAKVQFGLPYNSDAKTLRLDAGAGDGSSIGKLRRPSRVAFQLYDVGDFQIGASFDKMTPASDIEAFKADASNADKSTPLFTGVIRESMENEFNFDGQVCFRQNSPLPGMVQSITQIIEENDV